MTLENEKSYSDFDLKRIKKLLGQERYHHTQLVLKKAIKLAKKLDLNLKKVEKAALLHDIAKNKNELELKEIIKNSKWKIDQLELSIKPVLHAPAGAVMAEDLFGVKDINVLKAIRYHTLGHPEMGKIAQVIYAADFISEDRDFAGLDEIRKKIEIDFEFGLYLITTHIIKYQLKQNNIIHPNSNDLRNKLIKEVINIC